MGGPASEPDGVVPRLHNWSILLRDPVRARRDRVDFSPEERTLRVRLIGPALRQFYGVK